MKLYEKINLNKIDRKLNWIYNEEYPRYKVINIILLALKLEEDLTSNLTLMNDRMKNILITTDSIKVIHMMLSTDILQGSTFNFKMNELYKY